MYQQNTTSHESPATSHEASVPWLAGYRKWTATFAPLIIAALALLFNNPAEQETWGQLIAALVDVGAIGLTAWATTSYMKANVESKKIEAARAAAQPTSDVGAYLQVHPSAQADNQSPITNHQSPVEVPFDHDRILSLATDQAKKLQGVDVPSTERVFYSAIGYCQDVVTAAALTVNQVRDGYSFLLQLGKQAYFEQAKHPYGEGHQHLADYNPQCPYSTVKQMARDQGFEDTMNELIRLEGNLDFIEWTQAKGIDLIAKAPANMKSIYMIGEIARELHRQSIPIPPLPPAVG